jgi:hypothetical protein
MTETDRLALRFCERWDDAARGFLSAMFHDPQAGLDAGANAGLDAACFPSPELWTIADYLAIAAELHITPTVATISAAAAINRQPVHNSNDSDLEWLTNLETRPARVAEYARLLASFATRVQLCRGLNNAYWQLLGPLADYSGSDNTKGVQP